MEGYKKVKIFWDIEEERVVAVFLSHNGVNHCTSDIREGLEEVELVVSTITGDRVLEECMERSLVLGLLNEYTFVIDCNIIEEHYTYITVKREDWDLLISKKFKK